MARRVRHYGWLVSPYSAKTRSYVRYAQVPFDDVAPDLVALVTRIRPAVGRVVMPTVELPGGRFLHDSSVILDHFEAGPYGKGILPPTPRMRIACALLEVYADEWLPLASLHFRWNRPESVRFAYAEFGRSAAPWLPAPLQRRLGARIARTMQSYLAPLGIDARTTAAIESTTRALLADLDAHLRSAPYLFGGRPSLADFALYGPLYAHLYRDPGSRAEFDAFPALRAYLERMEAPTDLGPFDATDVVSEPVAAILRRAFEDAFRYFEALLAAADRYVADHPDATRLPRALGSTDFRVGDARGRRKLVTAACFKLERIRAALRTLDPAARSVATDWVEGLGGGFALRPIERPVVFRGHDLALAPRG